MAGRKKLTQAQVSAFDEIIVDSFAGGGGASTGLELALGREMYFANEDMRMCIVAKGFRGEWGKVIFGTREEAERALEGRTDDGN